MLVLCSYRTDGALGSALERAQGVGDETKAMGRTVGSPDLRPGLVKKKNQTDE